MAPLTDAKSEALIGLKAVSASHHLVRFLFS